MAKHGYGFNVRFPHFGIFLVIAIALAIPLTVWSLNNVSTQTVQNAQYVTPTPAPTEPWCFQANGTCLSSTICNSEGGYVITNVQGCATGTVCCKFNPTPTPAPTAGPTHTPTPIPTSSACSVCKTKTGGQYLVGGACGFDGRTLCQCNGKGSSTSSKTCSYGCKVNPGTYDTCATTLNLCSVCNIKQLSGYYLKGGACSWDGKTLCQCSGSGSTNSKTVCANGCKVNLGAYDTCR